MKRFFSKSGLVIGGVVMAAVVALIAAVYAPRKSNVEFKEIFFLLGTQVQIQISCSPERGPEAKNAIRAARDEIKRLESLLSPYIPESDVSRINRNAHHKSVKVSPETFRIIQKACSISEMTGGAFDITFAAVAELWNLDPENPRIPSENEIEKRLKLVDYSKIILNEKKISVTFTEPGMKIDLGGIAKGSIVDTAVELIRNRGFTDALVNAGGDIFASGKNRFGKPWKIGVRHPRKGEDFITKLEVSNRAVVTSGDYERMVMIDGMRYHHILDAATGKPAEKCISVTVVAPEAETADALSTALFVMGPEKGIEFIEEIPETEALIMRPDMTIRKSSGFES